MRSPYPEFELTNIIYIEKVLKETEIVFLLTVLVLRGYVSTVGNIKIF